MMAKQVKNVVIGGHTACSIIRQALMQDETYVPYPS